MSHEKYVDRSMATIRELTRVDADVGIRGNNTIILTGVYRKRAHVQFYDLGDGEFVKLVDQLREMKKYALIRNIDTVPAFKGFFDIDNELLRNQGKH